jgi:hypothetical protein
VRIIVEGQGRRCSGGVGRVHGSALSGRRESLRTRSRSSELEEGEVRITVVYLCRRAWRRGSSENASRENVIKGMVCVLAMVEGVLIESNEGQRGWRGEEKRNRPKAIL